ncbi:FHA domain protein [Methylobacterium sp. ap11]|uniref:FHA domain-containing protein n=1 Tax=Methylobacterium sp. ap11 TaxID=1761799 RepID=UPI0008CDCCB7|nr:FHA domain-containing protein [Methylobacterium sp. ap11]SEP41350.1 FHA domain protein [Methylobacterium sp. ap11]
MTLTLRVLQAPEGVPEIDARRLEPGAGPVSIGRGPDSDWVLPDPERHVSKLHCRIEAGADGFYLVDLSSNGVYFAEDVRPVGRGNRRALDAGDSFRIGDYRIGVGREPGSGRGCPTGFDAAQDGSAPGLPLHEGGISAILAGTSEASEPRAARGLGGPASDWLAAVPAGAADAQVVQPYGWQAPPATTLTDLPEAEEAFSDFASRSEHVPPINEALQLAPARTLLPTDWHLGDAAGPSPAVGAPVPAAPDWSEACAALIEGTGLGGLAAGPAPGDRAALVRAGQLLRRLLDVLATVEAVQRKTERDLGLTPPDRQRSGGAAAGAPAVEGLAVRDLAVQDLAGLVAELLTAGAEDAGDRLVARLAGVARDARALGLAVAETADTVGAQILPDAIEDAAREGTRLAVGPLLKAAAWERYAALHAALAGGEGAAAADAVLAPLRGSYARKT